MWFEYCLFVFFLSVSADPGSSTWMAALALTRGRFDRGAVVGGGGEEGER